MKDPRYVLDTDNESSIALKDNLLKYLSKWPWFVLSVVLCLFFGYLYVRYAPIVYASEAKIKIIDDSKEFDIATDALSLLGGGSKINLDNEIAVIKSYRLLDQVVSSLNLDIEYYESGTLKHQQIFEAPFVVSKLFPENSLEKTMVYHVSLTEKDMKIVDLEGKVFTMDSSAISFTKADFPIQITRNANIDFESAKNRDYFVEIHNKKETVLNLIKTLTVEPITTDSDVLSIGMHSESPMLAETILNEIVTTFNEDGIMDRQLVSKRTLDFIDDRFLYLSRELDSIEANKKDYKQTNNLSYIQADAGMTIEKRSVAESEVFRIETQIELSKLLENNLKNQTSFGLLPADIGVENANINSLVFQYNQVVLEREKLITSAGLSNPAVKLLSSQLITAKSNILNTVNSYQNQLKVSLKQLKQKEYSADALFSQLPEKEMMLRSIERQQGIKENLFLLLLQKREEAAINFAVTAPSIKVVDYGLTSIKPVSPKKMIVALGALMLGLVLPLGVFFVTFTLDTKIKGKADLEKLAPGIPVLAEIPSLKDTTSFFSTNERSVKAESFRILATNLKYLLFKKQNGTGHVIFIASAVKGEGKTFVALNLAMAFAGLKKKVLLVGADLRNPQLHNYFKHDKQDMGLSNFLYNPETNWKDCINQNISENGFLDICFSGPIPPNAAELMAGDNLEKFFDYAKMEYDYIILDTAPTVPVADTLLISGLTDMTVFVTRAEYTEKRLIEFSKELSKSQKLKNMAYVINDVAFNKRSGYNYGYEYGYD